MPYWTDLEEREKNEIIKRVIFDGEDLPGTDYSSPYAIMGEIITRMDRIGSPFIRVIWMDPRTELHRKFGAEFWIREQSTVSWGFGRTVPDAVIVSALAAKQGRAQASLNGEVLHGYKADKEHFAFFALTREKQ